MFTPLRSGTFMVLPALCFVAMAVTATGRASEGDSLQPIDFATEIRPILSDNCFACHGPDSSKRKAGLRMDERDSALARNEKSGVSAIVPGDTVQSELIVRITTTDSDDLMPPPESGKSLTKEQVALLTRWVEQGAQWDQHWSFKPITRPALPQTVEGDPDGTAANPIDLFVSRKLQTHGSSLNPSPRADRHDLMRRLTFDLTGLPPTLEEVEAFLSDNSPGAYEKVVDRLLRSEHYGEHMARFWLDAVRYGDTHGLHLDNYREIWPYRDWVIDAFNQNLPYDGFITSQLAGDLLPQPTTGQLVATGFNRCHVTTAEGGSIEEEVHVRNVVERVVATGTVFMGLTMDCTRCHDHKFDPLTMEDFYSMFAYFNNIDGNPMDGNIKDHKPVISVPTDYQQSRLSSLDQAIAAAESRLAEPWDRIDGLQTVWENSWKNDDNRLLLSEWYHLGPFADSRENQVRQKHGPEGGSTIDLTASWELEEGRSASWKSRPEWTDGEVHNGLPGDMASNFLYRMITVSNPSSPMPVSLGSDDGVKVYLNGEMILSRDVSRGAAAGQENIELPLKDGVNHLLIKIMNFGGDSGFYFSTAASTQVIPVEIQQLLAVGAGSRSGPDIKTVRDFYRSRIGTDPELVSLRTKLGELREERENVRRSVPTTLVWKERVEPRPAYILRRGEYDQKGREVGRRTPAALPPMKEDFPNDRLGFAMWLTMDEHPLTARVAVNRIWQQFFGTGIVKTSEDFGSQGEPPSHPDLLDWLAADFRDSGWDVKHLVKMIVMSGTYCQSSRVLPRHRQVDPGNRLLARGPRYRLDAEMLRDQALALSGLLVPTVGGPPVKPPQPDGLWFAVGYSGSNTVRFVADKEPGKTHRRSLYTFHKRTSPPPQMSTFDGPSREACVMRRERTNTPMQALLLMNDQQYVETAAGLARLALSGNRGSGESPARWMFRRCFLRDPSAAEMEILLSAYHSQLADFQSDIPAARQLVSVGIFAEADDGPDSPFHSAVLPELAAWTMVANLILNSDEILSKN